MQETLRAQGLQSAIGVTTARVFCGAVGGAARREYTMIGDGVNLAARLMQATIGAGPAGGGIMCDAATREAAETRIEFETLESIWVKGKAELVEVARPKGERRRFLRANIGLVGRAEERALLVDALHELATQPTNATPDFARVIILEADAGLGKTRLLEEARLQAERLGLTVFSGAGGAVEKNTPYFAWREVFGDLFDLALFESEAAQKRHLLLALGVQRLLRAPLLKAVLPNLDLPDNNFTRPLVGQARADNTRDLLVQLLQASIQRSPKLIILEDAHWLDSASWGLALAASRVARPWVLVIAMRSMPDPLPPDLAALRQLPTTRVVKLGTLSPADTLNLVMRRLGVSRLPEVIARFISERAEGNPFFSEELAYALRDAEVLHIDNGVCSLAPGVDPHRLALPDTVEGVITSRIDHLSPAHQLTLKIASVIGRVFQYRILREVHPIPADQQQLGEYLQHLHRLDLTPLESPEPDLAYVFKHLITQEVAYNLLPFAQRQSLHRAVAEWHERTYAADLTPYYAILAHHWRNAGAVEQALGYLHQAAEQAIRLSAYRETEGFCAQALSMLGFDEGAGGGRQLSAESRALAAQLAYHSGVALWGVGEFTRARQRLTASLSLARTLADVHLQADASTQLGRVLADVGEYVGSDAAFEEALTLAREHQYLPGLARVLLHYGHLFFNRHDFANAREMFEESRRLAQTLEDENGEGRALNMLGILAMYEGRLAEGREHFDRYLAIVRTSGERRGIAVALMNLGETEYRVQRYAEAHQHIAESLEIMRVLGERINVATNAVLLGLVHCELGEAPTAAQYFLEGLMVAAEIRAWPRLLFALAGIARLYLLLARPVEAAHLLGSALRHPATNADVSNTAQPFMEQLMLQLGAVALEGHLARGGDKDLTVVVTQTEAALRAVIAAPSAG